MESNDPKKLSEGYAPGYDEAAAYGDPNESSVGITKITFDRLLKLERPDACIALYAFYCYTGRWQKTEQAHCTEAYAAKALGWSDRTVRRVKAKLVAANLVNVVKHVDKTTGQVKGWYVRVRHMVKLVIHPDTTGQVDARIHPAKSPPGGSVSPKCLRTGNINALELVDALPLNGETKGRKRFIPPSIKEIEARCAEIGLDKREAQKFFDWHDSRGWKVGRMPMVQWRSALNTWKGHHDDRREQNAVSHKKTIGEPKGWQEWLIKHPEYLSKVNGKTYAACPEYMRREYDQERKQKMART